MKIKYVYIITNRKDNKAWYCFSSQVKADEFKAKHDLENEYKIVRRKIF